MTMIDVMVVRLVFATDAVKVDLAHAPQSQAKED